MFRQQLFVQGASIFFRLVSLVFTPLCFVLFFATFPSLSLLTYFGGHLQTHIRILCGDVATWLVVVRRDSAVTLVLKYAPFPHHQCSGVYRFLAAAIRLWTRDGVGSHACDFSLGHLQRSGVSTETLDSRWHYVLEDYWHHNPNPVLSMRRSEIYFDRGIKYHGTVTGFTSNQHSRVPYLARLQSMYVCIYIYIPTSKERDEIQFLLALYTASPRCRKRFAWLSHAPGYVAKGCDTSGYCQGSIALDCSANKQKTD